MYNSFGTDTESLISIFIKNYFIQSSPTTRQSTLYSVPIVSLLTLGKISNMQKMQDVTRYTKNLTLLYVEDDLTSQRLTVELLKELFKKVIVANDGLEGLKQYKNNHIDLILTDQTMPRMNGFEMMEKIREEDPDIPILMLSAYTNAESFVKAIEAGVDAYIIKPIVYEKIFSAFSKITSKLQTLKQARDSINLLKQYQMIVDNNSIVSKANLQGRITYVNKSFCQISGYTKEELLGQPHNIIRHQDEPSRRFRELWHTIKHEKKKWSGILKNRKKDGSTYYVKASISPIFDQKGEILEFIALRNDITDIMNQKRVFENDIANLQKPVVVYMQLDDFSVIEDFYDTNMVYLIQKKVKDFLEDQAQKSNIMFGKIYQLRYGEFAIAFDKETLPFCIQVYIEKLKSFHQQIKDQIVVIKELQYQISLLISTAYDNEHILESARIGIKKLHEKKKDFIIANNLALDEKLNAQKNLQIIASIKQAIAHKKIISYFQPIIENSTKKISRYESLVRLIDDNDKVLSPFEFLEVAKKGKYYHQITQIVLENSFKILKTKDIDIAINISLKDLQSSRIRNTILYLLDKHRPYEGQITLELLEDEDIANFQTVLSFINKIKEIGVKIAIDDFGSGYSNYERLQSYKPDILKIDGSLIKNIDKNNYALSIVKTIVSFAKDQNIKTTAEFVENETIYKIVKDLGIDYSQGYYFAKPHPL